MMIDSKEGPVQVDVKFCPHCTKCNNRSIRHQCTILSIV